MNLLEGFHKHHITPRYKGGNNSAKNLVLLHPIDHAIAHLVRYKIYGNPADGWAYNRIINGLTDELIPNKKGIPKPYLKKPKSAETRAKMSAALRKYHGTDLKPVKIKRGEEGYISPLKGVPRPTPWLVGRISIKKGVPISDETREKLSAAGKGRKQTAEQIAKRVASRRATLESQGRTK
ncbi:MAG: HNH endonuclease signature motif containing protein [Candidatus Puniceispirillaceae bacterium]|jgi:hypothetical protein